MLQQIQKLSQKLVLSKALQQSINILSMPTIELKEFVESESLKNPFIEVDTNITADAPYISKSYTSHTGDNKFDQDELFSKLMEKSLTLRQHLISQIDLTFHDDKEKFIAYYITDKLDENGYLKENKEDIGRELKVDIKKIHLVMSALKNFDPTGVYAENLEECLMLQAIEQGIYTEKFKILLDNLKMLANLDFKDLQKACNTNNDHLKKMITQLKKLNPKPSRGFYGTYNQVAIPEVIIRGDRKSGFYPVLNDIAIPQCYLQKHHIESTHLSNKENDFCTKNRKNALEIINAIAKRKKLLLNVAEKILKFQYEFFMNGINYLKPLVITDIASKLGVNVSTISRISNKYMETPYGMLEIKFFFSSKIKAELLENQHSSTAVKNKIRGIIANEKKVLSDEAISNVLKKDFDIVISRRTVAKYREALKIPSSAIRKRLSKIK